MADEAERGTVNKLTRKQSLFVDFYIQTMNATESARLAKYANPNTQGPRLLQNPAVVEEIESRLAAHRASADEVLAVLTNHMRGSLGDFIEIDDKGEPALDLKKAEELGKLGLLKKIDGYRKGGTDKDGESWEEVRFKIELHDPQSAAVQLGRYHKLFTDKTEVDGDLEVIIRYADD